MSIKAIIFDLDGTVADTLSLCVASFRKAIEPLAGRTFTEAEIVATFGPSEGGTIMELIPQHFDQGLSDFLGHYASMHEMCPKPFDGILEVIQWLKAKGLIVAMVTGKGAQSCKITLDYYDINHYFDLVKTGSMDGQNKTNGIQAVLEHFKLNPEEAIYVGDAVTDVSASKRAGVPIYSALWGSLTEDEEVKALGPDKIFYTIDSFKKHLEEILD